MNPPEKPEESDCCGSGCSPCIFDIYQQQLDRYKKLNSIQILDSDPNTSTNCISQTKYSIFRLTHVKYESLNTYLYTFTYVKQNSRSDEDIRLSYWPGQHFLIRGTDEHLENKHFTRAYTPLFSKKDNNLSFTVLIKLYEGGKMSNFLKNLSITSETLWRGPYGDYKLDFSLKNILMICQGTGIAPIYALVNQIVENEDCESFIKLFYCCRNSESIHLRTDIYNLSSYWNFKYEIFLSQVDEQFMPKYKEKIHCRRLAETDVSSYVEKTKCDIDFQVLICGSDKFGKEILEYIKHCGINESCVHIF